MEIARGDVGSVRNVERLGEVFHAMEETEKQAGYCVIDREIEDRGG